MKTQMFKEMFFAASGCLALGAHVGSASNLPAAPMLRIQVTELLQKFLNAARGAQIPEPDVQDALYALVAFIDEQILRSGWPGRDQWIAEPLQLSYFGENTAGEGFFQRLEKIENGGRREHVLQIYYACLALGFQGRYSVQGTEELTQVLERARRALAPELGSGTGDLSPHGYPADGLRAAVRKRAPIVALSIGLFALALLAVLLLRVWSASTAEDTVKQLDRIHEQLNNPRTGAS